MRELRASLRRLIALHPAPVLACHAPGATGPDLLTANSAYLDELERRSRAALERGASDVPGVDADVEGLIGFSAEAAAGGALPAGQEHYYRGCHRDAIRAMLAWLAGNTGADPVE